MALSDFLKTLGDKVFTPGVEGLLSAVPALVGSYEQARGRPIGAPLAALGQFGLTNAANRQATLQGEQDVAGRLRSLASQGLLPQNFYGGTEQAIETMSPEAAQKELSDIENQQIVAQQTAQAQQTEIEKEARQQKAREDYYTFTHPGGKTGLSKSVTDQLYAMGIDTAKQMPTAEQVQKALQNVSAMSGARAGATMLGKAAVLPQLPISMISPGSAVYAINPDGSYSPMIAADPRANFKAYQAGQVGVVSRAEQQPFDQQQTALKMLGRFKQVVNSPEVAGRYISKKPDLYSYLGKIGRAIVATTDPSAAARPVADSVFLADVTNKAFTNRTIANQLTQVRDTLMSPTGTVDSTNRAIDEAIRLIKEASTGMIQRGNSSVSSGTAAFLSGATTAPEAAPAAEAPEEAVPPFEGW